ncbi:DUF3857 domain-containing protein [Antarcticibacterium sp. 1MA-6-2]|uniref:DUF3857 domain-containing protein n=1 Tax=Antarcticibacterium sp. 1MA-6-2 TaxID=2908210 RepID=UPI001F465217|nr:DUF3857 domain-containing protein [Antarcticibacterium sp. 1MA-6-2]UJH91200.1 DUF3857 domain-containing protein [Antarcticibacterium sp. 1MA-6-2]
MNKFLLLFLFTGISCFAQNFNTSDLNVTYEELEATSYSLDSTANAFYIYEKGFSRFQDHGEVNLLTDYAAKIKILNPEGYEHASVEIRLYKGEAGKEKISKLEAMTFYLDNGIKKGIPLEASKIYTEENENYDIVKFTFPNISPGVVLTYSYQKESPYTFNFEPWWFQGEIPKVFSTYSTTIPGNFRYNITKIGELELDVHNSDIKKKCFQVTATSTLADCVVSEYAMKNIPAFIEEPYLTSRYNYISRIEYELIDITRLDGVVKKFTQEWEDVDSQLKNHKSLGKQLRRSSLVKDLLPLQLQQQPNSLEKAKDIYRFVQMNYNWNGEYKIFQDLDLKDVIKDNSGNVAGINILLHNIYEEEGFKVLPILGSTRSNGTISKLHPVLSEYNYVMLQLEVEGKKYVLDATEKNLGFGDVAFRSLNQYARLLNFDKESSWIDIAPEKFSEIKILDSLKLNADGTTHGTSRHFYSGYHALSARNSLEELSEEEIFNKLANPSSFAVSNEVTIRNKENIEENLEIIYQLQNQSQMINNVIYFNPFSFKFFSKNPLQLQKRNYPIDFGYKDAYSYYINIEIPENYKVEELPEPKALRLPEDGGTIQFTAIQKDDKNIMIHCRISFTKAQYSSGYYPYLKKYFDNILQVQSKSLIVLKENT